MVISLHLDVQGKPSIFSIPKIPYSVGITIGVHILDMNDPPAFVNLPATLDVLEVYTFEKLLK